MKTYTLLGHIFELEHRAHLFLTHYIKRIDDYATEHTISSEIVEDLKYNIIEKLYASQTPISEQYVMTVASNLGEPEDIFGSGEEQTQQAPKNLMEEWFGTNKPMLRGVCYWIAKSFSLPIIVVRIVMLGSLFIYGTGFWLYPILALFVPFQDKKSSSGSVGNIFFEVLRIVIWGGVIVLLGSALLALGGALIFGLSIPAISNQSLFMAIPTYLYVFAGLSTIALLTLFGGAVSALFKKYWLPKGFALASICIIIISFIVAGVFGYQKFIDYSHNSYITTDNQHNTIKLDTITINDEQVILNIHSPNDRHFAQQLRGWNINERIQYIEVIASHDEHIHVTVHNKIADSSASPDQPWTTIESPLVQGNTINLTIPDILFTKKVPFIGAYRTIRIAIPQDKHIIINNNTNIALNNLAPRQRYDRTHDRQIACTDYKHFTFNTSNQRWECSNHQTQSQASAMPEPAMYSPEIAREQALLHRTEEEARTIVEQQGLKLRVTERNGIESITMYDDLPNHIDVEIRNGRVIDVDSDMVTLLPATLEPPINSNNPTSHPQASAQQPSPTTQDSLPPTSTHITQQGPLHSIDYEDEIQRQYRGLTLQQAQDLASKTNTPIRVVEEDGIDLPITKDFSKGRINLELRNGKVIDLDVEGY